MKTFRLIITKIDKPLFTGEAVSVSLPAIDGEMTVLAEHEPYVTTLKEGTITVKTSVETTTFQITSGVLEISNNEVSILV
jgi:F-type H+-transporting ATPase subunit epsilon